jgi:hypothetical protein
VPRSKKRAAKDLPKVDEAFRLITRWQEQMGLSGARTATELGMSRGTLGSYRTYMNDIDAGREPSASARPFRFTRLEPEVQARIAEKLRVPLDQLRSLSMGMVDEETIAPVAAGPINRIGNQSALPEFTDAGRLRFFVAAAVDAVEGVGAVTIVGEERGSRYRFLDQHQIVVHIEPGVDGGRVRDLISAELDRLSLPGTWEHGSKTPTVTIEAGRELRQLGSIVCPFIAAPRASRSGLLLRLHDEQLASHRVGVVLSGPYAGSVPVGSYLAGALHSGHARFEDLVRLANAEMERTASRPTPADPPRPTRPGRTALADRDHDINAGYLGHRTLTAMRSGEVAGAWVTAMEVSPLDVYKPIKEALVLLPDVVVVLHYGLGWPRMAAWRLATARLDTLAQAGEFSDDVPPGVRAAARLDRPIWSSDQVDVTDGGVLGATPEETELVRAVLDHQAAVADEWLDRLTDWEKTLVRLEEDRHAAKKLTISVTQGPLPADSRGYAYPDGRFALQEQPTDGSRVVYPDVLHQMVDAWVDAAARVLHAFAHLSGIPPEDYAGTLDEGPAKEAYLDLLEAKYQPGQDPRLRIDVPADDDE